jgi:cbb3-type cytochrome oxidase maturation protein
MNALLFLVPLAVVLGAVFAALFLAAARGGQFDDLDEPARRILDE